MSHTQELCKRGWKSIRREDIAIRKIADCFVKRERERKAGQVCDGGGLVMKTHHPGGRLGGAKLGPASGVVGSAMVKVCDVFALCRCAVRGVANSQGWSGAVGSSVRRRGGGVVL